MHAEAPDPRRWFALALLCGAFFMVILDAAIVTVALPSIQSDLGFSPESLQWVVSAYALTFAGLLLLGGRAADLLGRRRVFMVGVVVFTGASLLCGLSWSPGALIGARALQGVGAAIMTPTALSIIMTTFADGPERNKALGIWGSLGGVGATAAWLIGGPLVDGPGWQWIFFINVPIGVIAFALCPVLLRESRAETASRSYDPAGALTITGALGLLVYAVVEAPTKGWGSAQTIAMLAGSALLLVAFVVIESRQANPLVPLRFLRSQTLVGANSVMLFFGAVVYGMPFILTLYTQQVLGYSALRFGLTSIVFPIGAAIGSISGQAIVLRVGFRPVATLGMALMAVGALLLTQVSVNGTYFGDIFLRAARLRSGCRLRFRHSLDRGAPRRPRPRGRACLRALEHLVPDRSCDRGRDRLDRLGHADEGLPRGERACRQARRADPRLPGCVPGKRHPRRARRGRGRHAARPAGELADERAPGAGARRVGRMLKAGRRLSPPSSSLTRE